MVAKGKSNRRIEPLLEGSSADEDIRLDAEDRVAFTRSSRARSSEKAPPDHPPASETRKRRGHSSAAQTRPPKPGGVLGLIRRILYWGIVFGIWGVIALCVLLLYYGAQMPAASSWAIPDRPPNMKITAIDGSVVANRCSTGGEALALEEMSPYLPQAVLSIEDRRYYSHFGVDPFGLARALVNNLTGQPIQGGSTITQQLAKNLFLSPERTFGRKIQELLLSFWLEQKFTKDQILAMYLNRVFFGSNAYGVEAASRRYFNKSAREINLGEAATLAGLLKAPSRLSPARDPAAAEARAQIVLSTMRQEGYITDSALTTAMSQPPAKARSYWTGAQHYAADMVVDEVKALIGEPKADLLVETTIDLRLEEAAEKTLNAILKKEGAKLNVSQAALVSVDATGAIRAVVGGRDYAESQFNRAAKAKRQPGSAFKPFVYASALEAGAQPESIVNDGPVRFGNWSPENYDQKYRGPIPLHSAFANSLNTVAAQLAMQVGPEKVVSLAHRLGVESAIQSNASIALGTSEVTLVELTSAYASFMNGGYKATPHIVRRIANADGKILYEADYANPPRVLSEPVAAMMNGMMNRVVIEGTGKAARIDGWMAAGKSGTTQSFRDALFVGYTSILTTGIWFGNDDGSFMKKVTGGGLPAAAWKNYMTSAMKGYTPTPIFGTGRMPAFAAPATAPAQQEGTTIGDIISGVFERNVPPRPHDFPPPPRPRDDGATVTDFRQYREDYDAASPVPPQNIGRGPVPPAEIGRSGSYRQPSRVEEMPPRRTTLFDILTGG